MSIVFLAFSKLFLHSYAFLLTLPNFLDNIGIVTGGDNMNEVNRVAETHERLREALRESSKTQTDLVKETGIDKGSMSSYFKGRYEPKLPAIIKLAAALNVSEMWLWGYDVPKEPETEKAATNDGDGLSESQRELMEFARGLSEEQAERALQILTLALQGLE